MRSLAYKPKRTDSLRITLSVSIIAALAIASIAPAALYAQKGPAATEKYHGQTTCPVMGGEIDSSLYVDMHGQRVYVCCEACIGMFGKDPGKYFRKAAADSVIFENVQEVCPVSGEPLKKKDPELFMYYEGRGLYFCCEGCMEKFRKDPETYLKKMQRTREMMMKEGGMEGGKKHGHGGGDGAGEADGCGAAGSSCAGDAAGCGAVRTGRAKKAERK